ncbi:cache domain-containing protein, partial [Rhodopseudomonas palustris]
MNLLSQLTIRTKISAMVALTAVAVCAVVAVAASVSQKRMLHDRTAELRTAVDIVTGIAQSLHNEVLAGKLTRAEAETTFRTRAAGMRFSDGHGYPAAYRVSNLEVMMNASNSKLEGKITGTKDSNGVEVTRAIVNAARANAEGGTATYLWPRPGQTTPIEKLVFARVFQPWDIAVAAGLYVDDLDADVRALTLRLAAVGAAVLALVGLLSWLIARDVLGALKRQQARMQSIATGSLDEPV